MTDIFAWIAIVWFGGVGATLGFMGLTIGAMMLLERWEVRAPLDWPIEGESPYWNPEAGWIKPRGRPDV